MKEFFKKYWYVIIIIICLILLYYFVNSGNNNDEFMFYEEDLSEKVEVEDKSEDIISYYVDIRGEVKNPGVYEIKSDKRIIDVVNLAGGLTKNADTSILNLSKKVKDEMSIKIYSKAEINNAKKSIKENDEKDVEVVEIIKEIEVIKEIEKECICPENNEICKDVNNKNDALLTEDEIKENLNSTTNKEESSSNVSNNSSSNTNSNANSSSSQKEENTKNEVSKEEDAKEENNLININTASKEDLMTIPNIGEAKALKIIEYRNTSKFIKIEDILNVSGIGNSIFEKIKNYITV